MGTTVLDPAGVKAVSEMPSREELIATIVGMIGAPAGESGRRHRRAGREHRRMPGDDRGRREAEAA